MACSDEINTTQATLDILCSVKAAPLFTMKVPNQVQIRRQSIKINHYYMICFSVVFTKVSVGERSG